MEVKNPNGKIKKSTVTIDKIIYGAAILYPAMALPQIFKIYNSKSAVDLSIHAYVLYIVFEVAFFFYGVKYKLKPIVIASVLWLVVYVCIILGIALYGATRH